MLETHILALVTIFILLSDIHLLLYSNHFVVILRQFYFIFPLMSRSLQRATTPRNRSRDVGYWTSLCTPSTEVLG